MTYHGRQIRIGVGIHDSSAALLPYLKSNSKPFILMSTGTWCVTMNPFNQQFLKPDDMANDCLAYMKIDGKPVKASRLFLGNEYKIQTQKLHNHFRKTYRYHKEMRFDRILFNQINGSFIHKFHFESLHLDRDQPDNTDLNSFSSFEEAYHLLMMELIELQAASSSLAMEQGDIKKIYIDGGFADNDIFVKLIAHHFRKYKIRTTKTSLGSALGAAMVISARPISGNFLKKEYGLKKHKPLMLKNE